jgi:hypothetical protein
MSDIARPVVVPFTRFTESRERRIRMAAARLEMAAAQPGVDPDAANSPEDAAVAKPLPERTPQHGSKTSAVTEAREVRVVDDGNQ